MSNSSVPPSSPQLQYKNKSALILSGGGARGAYEVGVLSYIFDDLARRLEKFPLFHIISGTSIGAVNACYLASRYENTTLAIRSLVDLWSQVKLSDVLGFNLTHMMDLPRVLFGGGKQPVGVFNVEPMSRLIEKEIPWKSISKSIKQGHLSALSISATEISSGRTVVFMQLGTDSNLPSSAPPRTVLRETIIGPTHALASGAIPILFPPVRIENELFMDGGVRQNTPIAPALRLGATHVFSIGLSRDIRGVGNEPNHQKYPGAAFILGKIMNAFLLDHIQTDLEVLHRINRIIEDGERIYGEKFLFELNQEGMKHGALPYKKIHSLVVRPSEDIGKMAAEHVRSGKIKAGSGFVRKLLSWIDVGEASESDLASYLLFDGGFAQKLIDLGRSDAKARKEEIVDYFKTAEESYYHS